MKVVVKGHRRVVGPDHGVDGTGRLVAEAQDGVGHQSWTEAERADGGAAAVEVEAQREVVHGALGIVGDPHMERFAPPGQAHRRVKPGGIDPHIDPGLDGLGDKPHGEGGINEGPGGGGQRVTRGLQVREEVGFDPPGATLGQHVLLVAEHVSDEGRGMSWADGGDALEGFLPGPEPPVFRLEGGGEDVEAVGRTMRFHEGQRPGLGGGEQRTVGPFQLHGGTGVEIDRHGLGARVRGSCRSLPDGFGEGEDDAGEGEEAHQQDEPMADAVPGPAFLPHLPEKGGLGELDLAVPSETEEMNEHRQGQRGERPEDLGVDELHREDEFSAESPQSSAPNATGSLSVSSPTLCRTACGVAGMARRGGRSIREARLHPGRPIGHSPWLRGSG